MPLHQPERCWRTTLDLDDDLLASAQEIAQREKKTAGQLLCKLARQALTQGSPDQAGGPAARSSAAAFGFRPFAARGAVVIRESPTSQPRVTHDLIRKLRDEADE